MYSLDYLEDEARICIGLARAEEMPEMKVILIGMALGWLNIGKMYDEMDLDSVAAIELETEEDNAT
jgi:hypothetical protein